MATDHQISIITNSSVKPPIRPDDGLPHTLHERVSTHGYWEQPENFEESDQEQGFYQPKRKVTVCVFPGFLLLLFSVTLVPLFYSFFIKVSFTHHPDHH